MKTKSFKVLALMVAIALVSGGVGYWLAQHAGHSDVLISAGGQPAGAPGRKALYWYDPMQPEQHFDKPGKSPFMDMPLQAKYADAGGDAAGLKIDPGVVQNLGVRVVKVERGSLSTAIDAVASVQLNDREVAVVQARSAGFVERVYARAPGDVIARGAPLADLLVPDWAGAQGEFLAMLKQGDPALVQATRERLQLLGMPAELIDQVQKSRRAQPVVTIYAPIGGLIQTLDVRTGMTVSAGAPLARINGLDPVWLEAAIPEAQAGLVNVGQSLRAQVAAYPAEVFTGKVIAVLPETNTDSRTLRVRVELPNHGGRLKPGMFAQVHLDVGASTPALLVPAEAVIRTGTRNIVLLALDGGRFQPVEVKLGAESGGKIAIVDGLAEGQSIVASGQFLIDSEASLSGVLTRLNAPAASAAMAAMPLNEAVGVIKTVKGAELTIAHGPVKSLGWPAMTMPFTLARAAMAKGLKPGIIVSFGFRESDDGYVIEKLTQSGSRP